MWLVLLAIIALACWRSIRSSGSDAVIVQPETATSKPKSFEEAMHFYLKSISVARRIKKGVIDEVERFLWTGGCSPVGLPYFSSGSAKAK
jgi:hypothetical protein